MTELSVERVVLEEAARKLWSIMRYQHGNAASIKAAADWLDTWLKFVVRNSKPGL